MRIGDKEYSRGLYCHAVSKVDVRLPGPGKSFTAVVGLDHNDDTAHGKGSVIFTVKVKDKVAFQSEVMRYGTPGREVNVDLGGRGHLHAGDWRCRRRHRLGPVRLGRRQGDAGGRERALAGRHASPGPPRLSRPRPRSSGPARCPSPSSMTGNRPTTCWRSGRRRLPGRNWIPPALSTRSPGPIRAPAWRSAASRSNTLISRSPNGRSSSRTRARRTRPILENLQALDAKFERGAEGEFTLHGNKGDWCAPQSYEPYHLTLGPGSRNSLRARRRPSRPTAPEAGPTSISRCPAAA